jgi:hypothetical protein
LPLRSICADSSGWKNPSCFRVRGRAKMVGMSIKDGVRELIGRMVTEVVVSENPRQPHTQVFLVLDDGTYYEFYGMVNSASGRAGSAVPRTRRGTRGCSAGRSRPTGSAPPCPFHRTHR